MYGPDDARVGTASGIMDYGTGVQAALVINSHGAYGDKTPYCAAPSITPGWSKG